MSRHYFLLLADKLKECKMQKCSAKQLLSNANTSLFFNVNLNTMNVLSITVTKIHFDTGLYTKIKKFCSSIEDDLNSFSSQVQIINSFKVFSTMFSQLRFIYEFTG